MTGKPFYIFYCALMVLLSPVLLVYMLWRLVVKGKSRQGLGQRCGFLPPLPEAPDGRIWVHAVSAGEAVAARPILQEIKKQIPGLPLVLSTTTPAGNKLAKEQIPEADAVIYFPLDMPSAVGGSLRRVRPRLVLTVETELWPIFFYLARAHGARTAMVNGRIAGKTIRAARRYGMLYRWTLSNLELCCMQSPQDAERIIAMGADPAKVMIVGNTKFDEPLPADAVERADALRDLMRLPEGTDLFVAGSTNPGEDEPVLDAFLKARERFPKLRLLIASRQLERADEIATLAEARGLTAVCRSALTSESPAPEGSVVLLDTMGELGIVYALATVAFVGGSLIPKGGHNILQPLAWGKPVFFGPHMHKSMESAELALSHEIGFQVADGKALGDGIVRLLSDRAGLEAISTRALEVIEHNRGAATRCAAALSRLLESEAR